jgi:hypothetical protein
MRVVGKQLLDLGRGVSAVGEQKRKHVIPSALGSRTDLDGRG